MSITPQLKHQWQSKQIILHRYKISWESLGGLLYDQPLMVAAIDSFKNTPKHLWVEQNNIKLHYYTNDQVEEFSREIVFYADVSEREFVDYTLRFSYV